MAVQREPRVLLVVTERLAGLSAARCEHYETVRSRIEGVAGVDVRKIQYEAADPLAGDVLVLSGSFDPWSAHDPHALDRFSDVLRRHSGPVLGICAGMQMLVRAVGGEVTAASQPVRGFRPVRVDDDTDLFAGSPRSLTVYQDHADEVTKMPPGFRVLASSPTCRIEAMAAAGRRWWGTQFHPEAWDAPHPEGRAVLERFFECASVSRRTASR